MAKKSKADHRVWLPKRTSPFARELDVALQLVSRAAAGVDRSPTQVANFAAQALVCDGIASEFADDTVMASETASTFAACDAETQKAVLELINEEGANTPCVNSFEPPYPEAVKETQLSGSDVGATLDKGAAKSLSARTWVLAPIVEADQPAVSLTLMEGGQPVVCAVALPTMLRNAMSGDKLLRMTVSFDGQSGALPPPAGTILWAEENKGAYERSIAGEHGTDVPIRVDRSLIGKRNIATGQVTGVQDFDEVTRCENAPLKRAESLASELGMKSSALSVGGPFAYGHVARGEAQTYFDLPDTSADFDSHIWAHAAGTLLVKEAGGTVTDTVGNELDFSVSKGGLLPQEVVGVLATNRDVHPDVLRELGLASIAAAAK
jgi:3'(2'), 5'-bisphosphate nucleotidase